MNLEELYSDIILDYAKNKKYQKELENSIKSHGHNVSCGDEIELYLIEKEGIIIDIAYKGQGCIISQASASMMCELIKGKTKKEAEQIANEIHKMARGEIFNSEIIQELELFKDIKAFPMRVKCFTLSWQTLEEGLKKRRNKNDRSN